MKHTLELNNLQSLVIYLINHSLICALQISHVLNYNHIKKFKTNPLSLRDQQEYSKNIFA